VSRERVANAYRMEIGDRRSADSLPLDLTQQGVLATSYFEIVHPANARVQHSALNATTSGHEISYIDF